MRHLCVSGTRDAFADITGKYEHKSLVDDNVCNFRQALCEGKHLNVSLRKVSKSASSPPKVALRSPVTNTVHLS